MGKYAAFLRGINVGGHKKVPMPALKQVFENLGFGNVKTLLISGNVVFEGRHEQVRRIPGALEKAFGFPIDTIVFPFEVIVKMVRSAPFTAVRVSPRTRLYVTFLAREPSAPPRLPLLSDDRSFTILRLADRAVFSVLDPGKNGTPEAMNLLEKTFGNNVTTRNFNTVVKVAAL
jgi:uncharacterized protein (DUF1697 family)